MPVNFPDLLKTLESGVIGIAKKNLGDYVKDAKADGISILHTLEDDLKLWVQQLEAGTLRKDDFEYNLLSQKDELKMIALEQAGLLKIKADTFKNDVFDLISKTVFGLIP